MSKKILSVVLALVFVVSTFAVSAFAVGDIALDPEASTKTQTWALSEPAGEGPYTVDVSLTANYKVGAIQFKVANADENALLKGVALNAAVFGADWEENYDVDFTEDGLVLIVPTPGNASKQGPDLTAGAVIVTLTYELAEGKTSATIGIANDPKNADNIGGSLIAVRMSDDSLTTGTLYYGQTVLSVGTEKTLGSAAAEPNTLVIVNSLVKFSNAYCNEANNGILCGFDKHGSASELTSGNLTTKLGDEYLKVVANSNGNYSTETIIQVLDADKTTVLESYVVVIFGDVDCDGNATTDDAKVIASKWRPFGRNPQSPMKVAANIDADADMNVTTDDATALASKWRPLNRTTGQSNMAETLF